MTQTTFFDMAEPPRPGEDPAAIEPCDPSVPAAARPRLSRQ
jgi:hypothetical protein